jgi:hypothetical protein
VSGTDGVNYTWLAGKQSEGIVTELHGKYYTQAYRGNVFVCGQAVAGVAVPLITATTQQCGIFNPIGSAVNVVPIRLHINYGSVTSIAGAFAMSYVTGCGGSYGTAQPVLTAVSTLGVPVNLSLTGQKSKVFFMAAGITTTAPGILMALGVNQLATTAAANTALAYFDGKYEFDGTLVIPPGTAVFFGGWVAFALQAAFSCIWEEVPI